MIDLSKNWKTLTVIGAIAGAGAVGYAYLDRYVTRDELTAVVDGQRDLGSKVQQLAESNAVLAESLRNTSKATDELRGSLQSLVSAVLARPAGGSNR